MENSEKEKIRLRAKGYRKEEIQVIRATPVEDVFNPSQHLRVAAYCRVSTDSDEQVTSYELQKNYYEELIAKHDNWELVGIYADEGISGTSLNHRVSFARMIEDAKAGMIDLIMTKSISRFARNVVDCITIIRELKGLNPPVRIFFETENIDTGKSDSEVMLNLLAIFAQEESHTKSEIMTWSIHQRFASGNFITPRLFGYQIDRDKPDRYIIVEEEAKVIRLVYAMYVVGYRYKEIADKLSSLGYVSNIKGECKWNEAVVRNIIDNERRCGKIIAWKTFTPSYLDHKVKKNNGNRDQFILDNHHDHIVPQEVYDYILKIKRMQKITRFRGAIPSLAVVKEGALKGFVLVNLRYPGFNYDNYLFASKYLDEQGISKERKAILKKSDVSDFDLEGYEKADSRLFQHRYAPTISFKDNKLYFNKTAIERLDSNQYIEILFEPKERLLAVKKASKDSPYAFKVVDKDERGIAVNCSGFMLTLNEIMKWNDKFQYYLIGTKRGSGDEVIILFDLDAALPVAKRKIDKGDTYDRVSINLLDEYYAYHYGRNIYEDAYSMRLYLLDLFKSWNVDLLEVPNEASKYTEWAKGIIENHLSADAEGGQTNG